MRATGATASRDQPVTPFASAPSAGSGARPPDISQMSPDERANRLFNRVMTLAEAGKQDSVQFFMPMALGAYDQLPALDADARYHVGLLHLAGGDVTAALAQADTIQRAAPNHLFIYILRAHAFQAQGNTAQEQRAYADFLQHEQAELALQRPEYEDHRESLTSFHSEALRQAQNPRRPRS
jgi:tetratricopeptide (TPR) repeat protein